MPLMPPLTMLDQACEAFKHNSIATKLVAIRTLLNDQRTVFNAHVHPSTVGSLSTTLITAAGVAASANLFEINKCCHAMGEIAGFFDNVKAISDEFKTKFNGHAHASNLTSGVPTSLPIAAAAITVNNIHAQWLSEACPALGKADGNPGAGEYFQQIAALANDLKTKYNLHYHYTAYTNVNSTPTAVVAVPTLS